MLVGCDDPAKNSRMEGTCAAFGRRNTLDPRTAAKDTSWRFRNWNEKVHHL